MLPPVRRVPGECPRGAFGGPVWNCWGLAAEVAGGWQDRAEEGDHEIVGAGFDGVVGGCDVDISVPDEHFDDDFQGAAVGVLIDLDQLNRVVGLLVDGHLADFFGRVLEDVTLAIAAGGLARDLFFAAEPVGMNTSPMSKAPNPPGR